MATINIFEKKVSHFSNVKATIPAGEVTIERIVEMKNQKTKSLIEEFRGTGNEAIKKSLPCYTVSGIFTERKASALKEHSGVVCIDIDGKDNTEIGTFSELKKFIHQIPYVAYCGLSCSGKGFFVLIPIEHEEKHKEHYDSICDDFERCRIKVDRQCSDVSRLRFVSLDEEAYKNYEAEVYTRLKHQNAKNENVSCNTNRTLNFNSYSGKSNDTEEKIQKIIAEIVKRGIDVTGEYKQWIAMGAALAKEFGDRGRAYFHEVSRHCQSYSKMQTDLQYDHCQYNMGKFYIGTFFYFAEKYGISY